MELYLLRHGQSEANAGLTDNLDSGLTPLGRQQADAAAERLAGLALDVVFVSPLLRTLETAEPICRSTGLKAVLYPEICEFFSPNYPAFQSFRGLAPAEILRRFPFVSADSDLPCELAWWPKAFEDDRSMYARAERVRDALQRRYDGQPVRALVVTHAETVGRLIEAFLRIAPDPNPPWSDNCGLSLVRWDPPRPAGELVFLNDTWHLARMLPNAAR
jgi:probable phosphoglycerate mutase